MLIDRTSTTNHNGGASTDPVTSDNLTTYKQSYRWRVLLVVMVALGISVIDRIAWASASSSYAAQMGTTLTAVSSFFTAFYAGYFISNLVSGFAADRFGGRLAVTVSLVLLGTFMFAFGSTTSVSAGLVVQCLMGLTGGMDYSGCVRLLTSSFDRRDRTTSMGFFLASVPLGLMLPNLFIPKLLRVHGWQGVYHILGIVTVCIGVLIFCVLRRDPTVARPAGVEKKPAVRVILLNRSFIILTLAGFGSLWGAWGFSFLATTLLVRSLGFDAVGVGFAVSFFGAVGIVVKPLVGWVADKIKLPKSTFAAAFAVLFTISLLIFAHLDNLSAFAAFSGLAGIGAWGCGVIVAALIVDNAGVEHAGSASGIANAIWVLGNATVPLAISMVYQHSGSFKAAIFVMAAGPAFSACILMLLPRTQRLMARVAP